MPKNILITYASYTGSAETIAGLISTDLESRGFRTSVIPMQEVVEISSYDAVIAGSAIHSGKWLPEAFDFLESFRDQLLTRPFAAYLVCMTMAMKKSEKYLQFVSDFMIPVRQIITPVSEGHFAGKLEIRKLPSLSDKIKFRISVAAGVWKEGDHINKKEILKWSETISHIL